MKLREYQDQAHTTAHVRAYQYDYLIPGIVGEVGELLGHRAKGYWQGWSQIQLQDRLVGEYGDIAWMTAILLEVEAVSEIQSFAGIEPVGCVTTGMSGRQRTLWGDMAHQPDPWVSLVKQAAYLYEFYTDAHNHRWIKDQAQQMWILLEENCREITGIPFDAVLQHNLNKLRSRAERGVLQGSGDNR